MEHVADEDAQRRSATGQLSDRQPGSVFNGDIYLNIADLPTGEPSRVQAQVNVARVPGANIFAAQGGNVYYYQGIPEHLPPTPSIGDSEERSESA